MSANAIYFALGLTAGFALIGALLPTIFWKRLWRGGVDRWGSLTTFKVRHLGVRQWPTAPKDVLWPKPRKSNHASRSGGGSR